MANQGFPIIDFHAHLPYGPWRPLHHPKIKEYADQRARRMALEWDFPDLPGSDHQEIDLEKLAQRWAGEVDRHGLERVVFVTGGGNENLARAVALHPEKFVGFAHLDPLGSNSAQELRRCVDEHGFRGLKIISPRMSLPYDHPDLDPVWRFLAERELPVVIHFGLLGHAGGIVSHPYINPLSAASVPARFPEIPLVIAHFGCGYWQETLHLAWAYPNVCVDTSGSNQWMRWMPYPLDLESAFRKAYETMGPERIIFGSDSSWFPRGFSLRYLQDQLRICRQLNFPQADIQMIFSGNARRLLKLETDSRES